MCPLDRYISRRKHNKPEISDSIAKMNSIEMERDGSKLISEPTKSATITMQMSSADIVHRLTAQ